MKKLAGFLEDHTGGNSAIRLYGIIAVVVFFGVWGYVSVRSMALADPPEMIVFAMLGVVLGKVAQRFTEKDAAVSTEKTTTETVTVTPEAKP
jgi:hypothetical protein